jgi:hypothetical protein
MPEFRFDPPLALKGNIVVRDLDDVVRFMIRARRPALQTSVLCRLEGAASEAEERHAGCAFRGWAKRQKTSSSNSTNKREQHDAFRRTTSVKPAWDPPHARKCLVAADQCVDHGG